MPKIVITMPAYRAAKTLTKTVVDIPPGVADLLLLVDDASPDDTAAIARSLGLRVHVHAENRGYGGNQKTCYLEALREGADVVVLLHPDYQYDPRAVPLLIAPILAGDADMTFGSRFAGLGDPRGGGMPLYRFVGNRLTTIVENLILGSRFTETHSGMRAFSRRCLLSLPFLGYTDDFAFDSQLLVDAVTSGLRVVEVPIPTRYTEESSSISVARSLKYVAQSVLYCMRQVWERGRRGRRNPAAGLVPAGRARRPAVRTLDTAVERWALDRAREYPVRGQRVVTVSAGSRNLDAASDADIVVSTNGDAEAAIVHASRALDPEGILAVLVGTRAAKDAEQSMHEAGLRLVAAMPVVTSDKKRGVLLLARPGAAARARPR